MLEVYHETAVFGPHRWMIRGTDNHVISNAQFTSEHDAKAAIAVGYAIAEEAKRELNRRIIEMLP